MSRREPPGRECAHGGSSGGWIVLDLSTEFRYAVGMDVRLPAAVITREGGADVVEVLERADGVLVERAGGREVDLLDVVVVLGLEPVAA